jgi:Tol biopolymer transport system component
MNPDGPEQADDASGRLEAGAETRAVPPEGRQMGVYRLEHRIGAGGMGEVFRAVDTRLNRPVAIKICSARFGERFDREARTISSLNHPHICTLYDIGPDYLVMELLDGVTLAARIRQGPLSIDEVLRYGAQLADALAEAHAAGIVHRDLKPGNVMITRHGAKILDFGLAKMVEGPGPTVTQPFAVVGTPAYMAPEQIAGGEADPRTDLFALGLVLYEMATGRLPLQGASLGSALASGTPAITPPSRLRAQVPAAIDTLVAQLLEKDRARRPDSATAVGVVLRRAAAPPARSHRAAVAAGIAAIVLSVGAAVWWFGAHRTSSASLQVANVLPVTNLPGNKLDPAYSPDGSAIAFAWRGDDGAHPGIYIVENDARQPRRLTQSDFDDVSPAWSPDGTQIAFLRLHPGRANELIVAPARGGPERKLRDLRQSVILISSRRPALTWSRDATAIVAPMQDLDVGRASLFWIGVNGETPRRLFEATVGDGDSLPAFSPDGRWLAYATSERANARLLVRRLGPDGMPDGEPQAVPDGTGGIESPTWSPDGKRLLFAAGARLMEWEVGGGSKELWVSGDRFEALAARWDGMVPRVVFAKALDRRELRELKLEAGGRQAAGSPAEFLHLGWSANPQLSRDGRWLVFATPTGLWIATAEGGNPHLLANLGPGSGMHISPDSKHVAFHKFDEVFAPLYVVDVDANGVASATRKVAQATNFSLVGAAWSPDGRQLYSTAINKVPQRVIRATISNGELEDLFEGAIPQASLDGHRIFYRKGLAASPLFARSLDGDIQSNPEEQLVPDCVVNFAFVPAAGGIYYVACDPAGKPVAMRFFDFSARRSFDVGPPSLASQPILTLSPDGRRLVYDTALPDNGELTLIQFRRGGT